MLMLFPLTSSYITSNTSAQLHDVNTTAHYKALVRTNDSLLGLYFMLFPLTSSYIEYY